MERNIKCDGLPGIMIPMGIGDTGDRGRSTFIVDENDESEYTITVNGPNGIYIINSDSLEDSDAKVGDFLIAQYNGNISSCEITYIDSEKCIANETSTLKEDCNFDIFVEVSSRNVEYESIGGIKDMTNTNQAIDTNLLGYSVLKKKSSFFPYELKLSDSYAEYISFKISSVDRNKQIGNIRVEVEFIPEYETGYMETMRTSLWENDNYDKLNIDYPFGFAESMSQDTNYDNENIGDFTVVIKDFNEGSENTMFESKSMIRKDSISNGTLLIYAYEKHPSSIIKRFLIGTMDTTEL